MLWQYRGTAGTFLIESIKITLVNNQGFVIKIQIAIKIIETWYWDIASDLPFFGCSPISWSAVPATFAAVGSTFGKIPEWIML